MDRACSVGALLLGAGLEVLASTRRDPPQVVAYLVLVGAPSQPGARSLAGKVIARLP